ncbi:hypothetical protein AMECASPLE_037211, partial [Ameca splendens]
KLSGRRRSLKKASAVNKRLASANLRSCWVGQLALPADQNCTVTTVTTVMRLALSFLQTGKTTPLGVVETGSLLGTLWNSLLSVDLREKVKQRLYLNQPRS